MMFDQHAMEMNEKVRNINGEIRQIQQRSVLPVSLLDVAGLMEHSLPRDASSDGIHFDTPKGTEWLNGVFQRHISQLESDMLEMAQFALGPPRSLLSSVLRESVLRRVFYARDTILDAFVQELLHVPINLLLALYLVYP